MQKAHENQNWENFPSDKTPINAQALNKLDRSVDTVDDRVIVLDTTKFDKTEAQSLIKSLTFDRATGIFTITYYNGATATIDTMLEKLAVNFDFDEVTQELIIYLDDGTEKRVDLSAFIVPIEFVDSDTTAFQLLENGRVSVIVKEGSIEEKHLRPNYLADIKLEAGKAQASATSAAASANTASVCAYQAKQSEIISTENKNAAELSKESAAASATSAAQSKASAETSAAEALASKNSANESKIASKKSEENSKQSEISANASKEIAKASEELAIYSASISKSYAVGGTGIRKGEDADNSKYYSEQSKASSQTAGAYLDKVEETGKNAINALESALDLNAPKFSMNIEDGYLYFSSTRFVFAISDGYLEWGLAV